MPTFPASPAAGNRTMTNREMTKSLLPLKEDANWNSFETLFSFHSMVSFSCPTSNSLVEICWNTSGKFDSSSTILLMAKISNNLKQASKISPINPTDFGFYWFLLLFLPVLSKTDLKSNYLELVLLAAEYSHGRWAASASRPSAQEVRHGRITTNINWDKLIHINKSSISLKGIFNIFWLFCGSTYIIWFLSPVLHMLMDDASVQCTKRLQSRAGLFQPVSASRIPYNK